MSKKKILKVKVPKKNNSPTKESDEDRAARLHGMNTSTRVNNKTKRDINLKIIDKEVKNAKKEFNSGSKYD